jgi:hypothetical protein
MQDYERQMDAYQAEADAYQAEMKQYVDDMDAWQTRYKAWKEQRDKAIGKAEGLIKNLSKDFGDMFNVNLTHHWGALCVIIAVTFVLVFVVQERKDII